MRLVYSDPDRVEFQGRDPVRSTVWVGAALLLGPTALAAFGPAPYTELRVASLAALVIISGTLLGVGYPRLRTATLRPRARQVIARDGRKASFADDSVLELVPVPKRGSAGNATYGVALATADAPRVLLLASDDPAETLADLVKLRAVLPLRVKGGWGLGADSPWVDENGPPRRDDRDPAPWDDRTTRRSILRTLFVATGAIAILMADELRGRMVLGETPSTQSILLPFFALSLLGLLTAVIATRSVRLHLGMVLSAEERLLGLSLGRKEVSRAAIRGAFLVSPSGHHAKHLVVQTDDGPVAFPCTELEGRRITTALSA